MQAVNDATAIAQRSGGASVQWAHHGQGVGNAHQLAFGASVDAGSARYTRQSQDAEFTADRATQPLADFVAQTAADATTRHWGAFVSASFDIDPRWSAALSARYNRAEVGITDRSGNAPQLNGEHRFQRLNPAFGLTFNPRPGFTLYASFNQGMRAPTATELTCADPDAPCKLPNNFIADPPLKPVLSQTLEFGARGQTSGSGVSAGGTRWSASLFRTDLRDDLQFVSSNAVAVNAGYFRNVGGTRRQGLELTVDTEFGSLALSARYSAIDATYRSDFSNHSPANSTADASGAIAVHRGDRIPAIARQSLKLRAEARHGAATLVAVNLVANSATVARGDENNRDVGGRVPGYAVVNLDARVGIGRGVEVFARIDNATDRRYSNFGVLARNVFTGAGGQFDGANARPEQFRSHGAPRAVTIGLEQAFD